MDIQVRRVGEEDVLAMRELYRQEANCQIIHDSFIRRGLSEPYLIAVDGRTAGYAGIGNKYPDMCVTEFYTLPAMRGYALPMFRAVIETSGASTLEAQTNMPLMLLMLYDCGVNITTDAILFYDAFTSHLQPPNAVFRQTLPDEKESIFKHSAEPLGDWLVEVNDTIVATGGFLTHYNPPYGDVYMEVDEAVRRQGYGSFVVQEVKRICYEAGKRPAARTGVDNIASRRTLQKAGLLPCGRLLRADVDPQLTNGQ